MHQARQMVQPLIHHWFIAFVEISVMLTCRIGELLWGMEVRHRTNVLHFKFENVGESSQRSECAMCSMMSQNVQCTPAGRMATQQAKTADLIMCAAVLGLKETGPDVRRAISRICREQLPRFLNFWTEGCCPGSTLLSVVRAALEDEALEDEVMAGPALPRESKAATAVANWRCVFEIMAVFKNNGARI